jgi:hypothetical protein
VNGVGPVLELGDLVECVVEEVAQVGRDDFVAARAPR